MSSIFLFDFTSSSYAPYVERQYRQIGTGTRTVEYLKHYCESDSRGVAVAAPHEEDLVRIMIHGIRCGGERQHGRIAIRVGI